MKIESNRDKCKLLALLTFPRCSNCQLRKKVEATMIGTRARLRHICNQSNSYITTFPCLDRRETCRDEIRIELPATANFKEQTLNTSVIGGKFWHVNQRVCILHRLE